MYSMQSKFIQQLIRFLIQIYRNKFVVSGSQQQANRRMSVRKMMRWFFTFAASTHLMFAKICKGTFEYTDANKEEIRECTVITKDLKILTSKVDLPNLQQIEGSLWVLRNEQIEEFHLPSLTSIQFGLNIAWRYSTIEE